MLSRILLLLLFVNVCANWCSAQNPENLLLKNFKPRSIDKVPVTRVDKARFPVIDIHSHNVYVKEEKDIKAWISLLDKFGIEKVALLTKSTGRQFDSIYNVYSPYLDRFELWCGFDYTGYQEPGWVEHAVKELERCVKKGARGVGELGDKGLGELYSKPVPGYGMHIDDKRLQPLFRKCGELNIPVSIHVADPMWMYEPMDSTNDGLMNAYLWKIDTTQPGLRGHAALVKSLENVVAANPNTTIIACHLANCEYDLSILGNLLSKYDNLYADISARFGEIAPIPRFASAFIEKYQDKLLYGTDNRPSDFMYETTFRILETQDEHFYATDLFEYHWPLQGFGLSDEVLKKIYKTNAMKIRKQK